MIRNKGGTTVFNRPFEPPSLFRDRGLSGRFFRAFVALSSHREKAYEERSRSHDTVTRGCKPRERRVYFGDCSKCERKSLYRIFIDLTIRCALGTECVRALKFCTKVVLAGEASKCQDVVDVKIGVWIVKKIYN